MIGNGGTLTVNHPGVGGKTQLIGQIIDLAGQPGSVSLLATSPGAANNNNFIFYGVNTYSGPTTIQVNTGSNGSIQIGNDHSFGTGTVTVNLVSGAPAPQFSVLDGLHALANKFNLNSGMTFVGPNSLVFRGPITIINSAAGGTRTLSNSITTAGRSVYFGDATGQSTITLGNPVASGGDGVGKTAIFNQSAGATTVINHVMQDPAAGGGAASGSVQYAGSTGGVAQINGLNTYTGSTTLNGAGTIVRLGVSSNGLPGPAFTAGPFGTGTVIPNNLSAPPILQAFGADRTIANAITMSEGFSTSNPTALDDPTGPHNLTLAGPITLGASGRSITNNFVPGVALNLGSAASPSTISLVSALTIQGQTAGGGRTIVNSAISGTGGLIVQNNARVELNHANNNYSGLTTVGGTGSPTLLVNGAKTGSGGVTISNGATLGGTGSIAGVITNNGTIAPGASVGTLTAMSNVAMGANSHLAIELNGTSADKLVVGGHLNLSNVDYLDVTNVGGGQSWVIATYSGTLTGTFNNITPGYSVNYGAGLNSQITLSVMASGVPGDFNNNGKVDTGDYIVWRKTNGTTTPLPNDNGLGTPISNSHRDLWRSNFGNPPGSGGGARLGDEIVPEPTAMLLFLLAMAALLETRTRRCSIA
jgi:hypothetical protein